jgi:hypothetical protein
MAKSRRQTILDTASDTMSRFLYDDRKEDEDLRRGEIGEALAAGEVTIKELLEIFRASLTSELKSGQKANG